MKVEIKDMNFGYGSKKVLNDINLTLDEPGLVCIVGPNGVGKSTLVKCILGIHKISSGSITVDGVNIQDISLKNMAKIMGFVPVKSNEVFSMSVMDTVMMGRYPHQKNGIPSSYDWKIVKRALNMMGVKELAMQDFNELSAGQHQKVAITKGLAQTTRLLILDEPTSNLDPRHQLHVTETLRDIAHEVGMTILMVSHDLNLSARFADKVIVMAKPGVIHTVGAPQEVFTEETISMVYGVECTVVEHNSRPLVILERALPE